MKSRSRRPSSTANVAIAFALAIGLGISVTLIALGGRDRASNDGSGNGSAGPGASPSDTSPSSNASPSATLPVDKLPKDPTSASLAEMSGLVFPTDMADFRSVVFTNDSQIDLSFKTSPTGAEKFVTDSGLPSPSKDERVLMHSSPLWELNPGEGSTISSTSNERAGIRRAVEMITASTAAPGSTGSDGGEASSVPASQVEVRVSLTPAG